MHGALVQQGGALAQGEAAAHWGRPQRIAHVVG